jgi:predicted transposase YbfD/YdcC
MEIMFRKYSSVLSGTSDEYRFVNLDGKTACGSFDKSTGEKSKHILYAFMQDLMIILAHEEVTKDKTNEIPKAQIMIKDLNLGTDRIIFTADAMNCQIDTIKEILKKGNGFLLQVKGNQKSLLKSCQITANNRRSIDESTTINKGHGRVEKRKVRVFQNTDLVDKRWRKYVNAVIHVKRTRIVIDPSGYKHEETYDESYYISNKQLSARRFGQGIRDHWSIENNLNYVKDQTMGEDKSRIRKNPENFIYLKDLALNIMRINKVTNIKSELYKNVQNLAFLDEYKFI